jgi:hypothetical protein
MNKKRKILYILTSLIFLFSCNEKDDLDNSKKTIDPEPIFNKGDQNDSTKTADTNITNQKIYIKR